MGNPPSIRRIKKEDFPEDAQQLIDKLGYILNPFMDEVINLFKKNIDFSNLKESLLSVTVKTDTTGKVVGKPTVKSTFIPQGLICINVTNSKNPTEIILSSPYISFTVNNAGAIEILHVSGLSVNSEYLVRFIAIP
jgi:hypothetical protein